ncbi:MAG: thiamine pyrophosphate-binding protein [Candidatus Poribacteria bacterium]|nr:thiamine pyrophosphate-binding protein [Candidatus Poribacteria bacterium]
MDLRPITASPSQILVEQLAALGVNYVFNNSGSREAHFFDALNSHPKIHGILGLHEGSVAAMAGGYAQVKLDPAVMLVHLGAGLAQCLGQFYNVWYGSLPVVLITFAGDTGSYGDRVSLDLGHSVAPTSIAAPMAKAAWSVIEPEGLPQAIYRAIHVAKTPPVGPVHLAVYDRMLYNQQVSTNIIETDIAVMHVGYPDDDDVEKMARLIHDAERPVLYIGDGIWKNRAESEATTFVENFGLPVVNVWGDLRSIPLRHRFRCGHMAAIDTLDPDLILCLGVRHAGLGIPHDYHAFTEGRQLAAIGSDTANIKNIPGLDFAILADEKRTLERLNEFADSHSKSNRLENRRGWAQEQAASLHAERIKTERTSKPRSGRVRPWLLRDSLDEALNRRDGGVVMIEQYVVPVENLAKSEDVGDNLYLIAAGGSEGYGVGAAIGAKLAALDRPVVGLVGDGSLCYADSGLWTAVHHGIPLLYVISNNRSYGIVAHHFGRAKGSTMEETDVYPGVVLSGIDPVKIAEGFGVEAVCVKDESCVADSIERGLDVVEREGRPFLLDVHLPLNLPNNGRGAEPFRVTDIGYKEAY